MTKARPAAEAARTHVSHSRSPAPDPASGPDHNRRTTHSQNTWASYTEGDPAAIVLHSVPPLVVFAAVEAITDLRDKLTDAVLVAAGERRNVHSVSVNGGRRKLFADYLAEARALWTPGVEITPAWVRQATGCSRGLSPRLARALLAEVADE